MPSRGSRSPTRSGGRRGFRSSTFRVLSIHGLKAVGCVSTQSFPGRQRRKTRGKQGWGVPLEVGSCLCYGIRPLPRTGDDFHGDRDVRLPHGRGTQDHRTGDCLRGRDARLGPGGPVGSRDECRLRTAGSPGPGRAIGGSAMRLLYGDGHAGHEFTLTALAAAFALNAAGMAADHGLRSLGRPRVAFTGSLIGFAVTIAVGAMLVPTRRSGPARTRLRRQRTKAGRLPRIVPRVCRRESRHDRGSTSRRGLRSSPSSGW